NVTGVQTCALPIFPQSRHTTAASSAPASKYEHWATSPWTLLTDSNDSFTTKPSSPTASPTHIDRGASPGRIVLVLPVCGSGLVLSPPEERWRAARSGQQDRVCPSSRPPSMGRRPRRGLSGRDDARLPLAGTAGIVGRPAAQMIGRPSSRALFTSLAKPPVIVNRMPATITGHIST